MRRAVACAVAALVPFAAFACRSAETPAGGAAPPSAPATSDASLASSQHGDGGFAGLAGDGGRVPVPHRLHAGFAASGAIIVRTPESLVSIAADGTRTVLPLPPRSRVAIGAEGPSGVVGTIEGSDDVLLINLSPLSLVHRGRGRVVDSQARTAAVVETVPPVDREVAVWVISSAAATSGPNPDPAAAVKAQRLLLPEDIAARVESVHVTDGGRYALVHLAIESEDTSSSSRTFAYEVATGKRVSELLPTRGLYPGLPTTTVYGEHQIGFRGGDLVEVDIPTGATLHRAASLCTSRGGAAHHELIAGNPQVDPTGTKIIATCNGDGVMVDAATFKRVRTYPHLVPGCDNGEFLPAHFNDAGTELLLHGCDGEADLDLKTGKFVCADRDELMGAADPMRKPTGPAKVIAKGHGVPECPDNVEAEPENGRELNEDWTAFETSDPPVVVGPSQQKVPFEPWMAKMKVAPKGDRFLLVNGTHVLVYNMADRKLLSELVF